MTRAARLPFSFGQRVKHPDWRNMEFTVLSQEVDARGCWTISVTDRHGGFWRLPAHELSYVELHDEHQAMAEWLGCSVERMERHHDRIHAWLAERAGVPSYSLKVARGEPLTEAERRIAAAEEDATLQLQRYLVTIENEMLLSEAA